MKFAVGLMACIAIAFTFITSPQSQPQASSEMSAAAEQSAQTIDRLTQAVVDLQRSIDQQRDDLEQRIDAKFVAFTETLPAPAVPDSDEVWAAVRELEAAQEKLEARIAELEAAKVAAKPTKQITGVGPVVWSTGPVVSSSYSARWNNHDGRTARQHAIEVHGFDASLSDAQLAAQHDAYHDQFGSDPPLAATNRVFVNRAPASRQRTTTVSSLSNCPGGVCPTSRTTTVQSRGGLLGFGIIGRRR